MERKRSGAAAIPGKGQREERESQRVGCPGYEGRVSSLGARRPLAHDGLGDVMPQKWRGRRGSGIILKCRVLCTLAFTVV